VVAIVAIAFSGPILILLVTVVVVPAGCCYYHKKTQIDDLAPSVNISVIPDFLANGTLALRLQSYDVGSGVRGIDIYQLTGITRVKGIRKVVSQRQCMHVGL